MATSKREQEFSMHIKYTSDNVEYIDTMSRALGLTKKDFVNTIIANHKNCNIKDFEAALSLQNKRDEILNNMEG